MIESDLATLDREALVALILKQAAVIGALRAEVESLTRSVVRPKQPGRRHGRGPFRLRESPRPEDLSKPPIGAPVDELGCPRRGGELVPDRIGETLTTDLSEVVKPRVRLFRGAVHRCVR